MIFVVAELSIAPGKRDQFLTLFQKLVPEVHSENGCIEYVPLVDIPAAGTETAREDVVTVFEKWESLQALDQHQSSPHMTAFRDTAKELIQGMAVRVYNPVAE